MTHSPVDASLNLHREERGDEVLRLRDTIEQHDAYNQDRRRTAFNLLQELLQEIRVTRKPHWRCTIIPRGSSKLSFHDHALDLTYGHSHRDIRNHRGSTVSFLNLKEARNMILEIDGTSRNCVREFLNASTYVMKNIHPVDEHTLLDAVLCTKFKGKAIMDFREK